MCKDHPLYAAHLNTRFQSVQATQGCTDWPCRLDRHVSSRTARGDLSVSAVRRNPAHVHLAKHAVARREGLDENLDNASAPPHLVSINDSICLAHRSVHCILKVVRTIGLNSASFACHAAGIIHEGRLAGGLFCMTE